MQTNFDLYTDYLLSSFGQTSATNMARLLDDQISHDDVTRFLSQPHQIGQTRWKTVKPLVYQQILTTYQKRWGIDRVAGARLS